MGRAAKLDAWMTTTGPRTACTVPPPVWVLVLSCALNAFFHLFRYKAPF